MVWGWDRLWEGAGPPRCQAHMPPGRSHLPVSDAPLPGRDRPWRQRGCRARDEQRPRGIPGGNSGVEGIVGVPGEILGIRIGVSSFLPQQPPQAVCPEPMSYSVSQKLPQIRGREREGGAPKSPAQPFRADPRGRRAPSLAPSRSEASQLGLGSFPALALGWAGCFWKHFQHFLNGPAVSRARRAGVTASDAQQGGADSTLNKYP